jgi:hypothetical protein
MSKAELDKTGSTHTLRPGKDPPNFFTSDVYNKADDALNKLSMPKSPEVRVKFSITNDAQIHGPRTVAPASYNGITRPGGGIEYWTMEQTNVQVLEVF